MPAPSQVSTIDINYELGGGTISNTASMNLNSTSVRNLASILTGAISFGDCRWGINFPAGIISAGARLRTYGSSARMDIIDTQLDFYNPPFVTSLTGTCTLTISSTGSMTQSSSLSGGQTNTWLTSGVNSDYTARVDIITGTLSSGTTGSDLALSTTRTWTFSRTQTGVGFTSDYCNFFLTIKSGSTLIIREYYFETNLELQ